MVEVELHEGGSTNFTDVFLLNDAGAGCLSLPARSISCLANMISRAGARRSH